MHNNHEDEESMEAIDLQENPHAKDNLSSFLANVFINKREFEYPMSSCVLIL